MIFLVLMATIGTAIYATSTVNMRTSYTFADVDRARLAAESGMRWFSARMRNIDMPEPLRGYVGGTYGWDTLWDDSTLGVATAIKANLDSTILATSGGEVTITGHTLATPRIPMDTLPIGAKFSIEVVQDPSESQRFYVTSTGYYRESSRRVRMEFWMDKKIPYAVIGKVPIQIGKNVLVRGAVGMTSTNFKGQPGVLCLSDFKYTPGLESEFQSFQNFLMSQYGRLDNSINLALPENRNLAEMAATQGWHDLNGDGRLNEYDVFLKQFANKYNDNAYIGPQITKDLWTRYISPADLSLFTAIDQLQLPLNVDLQQKDGKWQLLPTGVSPKCFQDDFVDNRDNYAKILGQVKLLSPAGFDASLLQGPIISPNPNQPAVQIADPEEQEKLYKKLYPAAFTDACAELRARSGPSAGTTATKDGRIQNKVLALEDIAQTRNDALRALSPNELTEVYNPGNAYLLNGNTRVYLKAGQALTQQDFAKANSNSGVTNKATSTDTALVAVKDPGNAYLIRAGAKERLKVGQGLTPDQLRQANEPADVTVKAREVPYRNYWVIERTPWGSTTSQAIYKRPVYRNITFESCIIPRGLNALFIDCTFEKVTFVDTQPVTGSGSSSGAWNWIDYRTDGGPGSADRGRQVFLPSRDLVGSPSSPDATTQIRTKGSEEGNNLRFDSCNILGPMAGNTVDVYTHCANSWEFGGNSVFNNKFDDTVTICSPQVNIEMGSYEVGKTNGILMKGVVVAGNIDVRGEGCIDGSVIVTGDGAGNTTLGYFGPSDSTGSNFDPADVVARSGYLIIKYNSRRVLPDGVKIPLDLVPDQTTYREVLQ